MHKDPKLFQHGILAMLVAGLFDGTMSIGNMATAGSAPAAAWPVKWSSLTE
ncbi:hypothetical protein [Lactobacillus delbrueckii]|uniref:hypothetical protein n=1 Tax=Lactobacillus delbrueckii TaxID=1584 RepID=UPI0011632C25|nr:hypothetical protein [Lactobacillus delbrueckii]BBL28180.1 hypothetical protein LDE01_14770 [Lactobacillus delbrueckii subsp. delbrueckii]GEA75712.1 hypothetical protein LDE03_15200 [Lactobacillus delbrueckii subsp. delbrueckii]